MEIKRINDSYSVSGQVSPADIDKLVEASIRSIVCNRPDGEGADQPRAGFDQHLVGTTRAQLTQQCS